MLGRHRSVVFVAKVARVAVEIAAAVRQRLDMVDDHSGPRPPCREAVHAQAVRSRQPTQPLRPPGTAAKPFGHQAGSVPASIGLMRNSSLCFGTKPSSSSGITSASAGPVASSAKIDVLMSVGAGTLNVPPARPKCSSCDAIGVLALLEDELGRRGPAPDRAAAALDRLALAGRQDLDIGFVPRLQPLEEVIALGRQGYDAGIGRGIDLLLPWPAPGVVRGDRRNDSGELDEQVGSLFDRGWC